MSRVQKVSKVKEPGEYLVVRVNKENIQSVLNLETTAICHDLSCVDGCRNIILVVDNLIVAVGTIDEISDYNQMHYSHIFKVKGNQCAWKTKITFSNTIILGAKLDDVFKPSSKIKYVTTFMKLKDSSDVDSLLKITAQLNLVHISNSLCSIGIK